MLDSLYSNTSIFVVDNETFLILCSTDSIRVANAICKGLINATTMVVSINQEYEPDKHYYLLQTRTVGKYGEGNAAKISNTLEKNKRHALEEVLDVPDRFLERKELVRIRKYGIEHLEKGCIRYSARLVNFFEDSVFLHFISRELELCDPINNLFSDGILEWATIYGMVPKAAYHELKMHYDSTKISVIKIHALWNKYTDKINTLTNIKDIHLCAINEFEVEIFLAGSND